MNPALPNTPPQQVPQARTSMAQPAKPKIERPVKFFEKGWAWFLVTGFVAFILFLVVGFFATGVLNNANDLRFGPNIRGYTFAGIAMGVLSLLFMFLTGWYSLHKRRNVTGASMMTWLWSHVWLGLLALFTAALHAGFGLISLSFTSGKLLFFFLFIIVFTGILWRLAYSRIPPKAAAQVLNYSKEGALDRAEQQALEIAKLTAGKSDGLQRIKEILLQREIPPPEMQQLASQVPPEEQALLEELILLAASRRRALARPPLQERFTRKLQGWRKWHVPLAFVFLGVLGIHLFGAFDLHRRAVPVGLAQDGPLAAYRPSADCGGCHRSIYNAWKDSMHAHAITSPITVVQNNLDMKHSLGTTESPDPRRMCINCHGPAVAAMTESDHLPLGYEREKEGVECVSCHQLQEAVTPGGGALASVYNVKLQRGDVYFGRLDGPVGNAYHRSERNDLFDKPELLCATCHMVNYDKNHDGRIVKGVDLVLQTTLDEYREYQKNGGKATCVSCHMPVVPGARNAADGAVPLLLEDYPPPDRQIHDHSFVGVDYPLDEVAKGKDPQKAKRAKMLASAATFSLESTSVQKNNLAIKLNIDNQTGHNLPTGFAFARQMFIELVVQDGATTIFSSGVLKNPADDLCDDGTFGDLTNPLRGFVNGCAEVDKHLVNIQLKLVDKIAALADPAGRPLLDEGGEHILIQSQGAKGETYLQELTGGAVARKRPIDGAGLGPIRPLQRRSYTYNVPLPPNVRAGTFTARLLFRNLPPYWLRGMAREQPRNEKTQIEPLIPFIQTVEMAKVTGSFAR
ncbi:MAG: hypothetical protein JST00_10905 [Deltaproteobacteria bacterium]|nr:hypothetical protein [Deltaproteobacteria bacterium]